MNIIPYTKKKKTWPIENDTNIFYNWNFLKTNGKQDLEVKGLRCSLKQQFLMEYR